MIVLARPDLSAESLIEELRRPAGPPAVMQYESRLRELLALPVVHAVDSGRGALAAALRASASAGRNEVIVPSFICPAVVDAIRAAGRTAVLADSAPGTPNVSAAHVAELLGPRTHAVVVPHVFGVPAPVAEIGELARRVGAVVVEDCAHAVGSVTSGQQVGRFGTFAIFSTNFDKPFTTGYGGALAVNDPKYAAAVDTVLRAQSVGRTEEEHLFGLLLDVVLSEQDVYRHGFSAGQGRLWLRLPHVRALYRLWSAGGSVHERELRSAAMRIFDLQPKRRSLFDRVRDRLGISTAKIEMRRMGPRRAALGIATIGTYEPAQATRQRNAVLYSSLLAGQSAVATLSVADGDAPQWLRYAVLARDAATAKDIIARAAEAGYRVGNANWPAAIHQLPKYRRAVRAGHLPNAEAVAARIVNLPLHGEIGEADVRRLAAIVGSAKDVT